MREILFKAKRKNWSELPKEEWWVEGSLLVLDWESDYVFIMKEVNCASTLPLSLLIDRNCFLVDKETICQYTGLKDKDGNRIWENDVVKYEKVKSIGTVKWYSGYYVGWCVDDTFCGEQYYNRRMWNECEVIGNIFDNPELLERS